MSDKEKKDFFSKEIVLWYQNNQRKLPWRESKNPYFIWISEIMLQQTQVKTVIPYFNQFIIDFPTIESLAEAHIENVLAKWSGLGYYRRARQLKEAAEIIVKEREGIFPDDYNTLLSLPGIGRYTAGALLSIAFNKNYPILDGNVKRVLSRYFLIEEDILSKKTESLLWTLAEELIPDGLASDFNQGMMELGALICSPVYQKQMCISCPVQNNCLAKSENKIQLLPVKNQKKRSERLTLLTVVIKRDSKVLLKQRPKDAKLLKSMWEFPFIESKKVDRKGQEAELRQFLEKEFLLNHVEPSYLGETKHNITYRKISVIVYEIRITEDINLKKSHRWVKNREALTLPHSSLLKKVLGLANNRESDLF